MLKGGFLTLYPTGRKAGQGGREENPDGVKPVGVSNWSASRLERFPEKPTAFPAINQIELQASPSVHSDRACWILRLEWDVHHGFFPAQANRIPLCLQRSREGGRGKGISLHTIVTGQISVISESGTPERVRCEYLNPPLHVRGKDRCVLTDSTASRSEREVG